MAKDAHFKISKDDGSTIEESVSLVPREVEEASASNIADLSKKQYPAVGHCIYCSSTEDLRREHIVPFGLDGTAVLPAASCGRCAEITGKFELQVLRGPLRQVRLLRKLRSRSKHRDAPKTAKLRIVRGEKSETIELPIEEFPILLHFPEFGPPGFLDGWSGSGIRIKGIASVSFGPSPDEVATRLAAEKIEIQSGSDRPVAFARMLAKIGYAMALAQNSLSRLDGPSLVLPAILGQTDDIGQWVGTLSGPIRKYHGLLHRIFIHEDHERGLLVAEVQLFADSETPSYGIILGRLKA